MVTKRIYSGILVVAAILVFAGIADGQIMYGQPASGNTGFVYTSWKLSDSVETTISQFWVPVSGFVPLQDNLELRYYFAGASTSLDVSGSESVAGLGNARVQVSRSFGDDKWLMGAGLSLPTGKRELSVPDERAIVELLSQNFLDFPMRKYGDGLGANVVLGMAQQVGGMVVGAGALYEFIGKYKPYEGTDDYDPGDLITVNGGADIESERSKWSLNTVFTTHIADKVSGTKVFKQADQLEVRLSSVIYSERMRFTGSAVYVIRGRNDFYDASTEDVVQRLKLYGNELGIRASLQQTLSDAWSVTPQVRLRLIAGDEVNIDQSQIYGVGVHFSRRLGGTVAARFGGMYLTGQADDGAIDLSGFQLSTMIGATF